MERILTQEDAVGCFLTALGFTRDAPYFFHLSQALLAVCRDEISGNDLYPWIMRTYHKSRSTWTAQLTRLCRQARKDCPEAWADVPGNRRLSILLDTWANWLRSHRAVRTDEGIGWRSALTWKEAHPTAGRASLRQ